MSLQYIIDGYNITNHPKFTKQIPKRFSDSREALIQLIKTKKSFSPHNKFWVVFDGYSGESLDNQEKGNLMVIFSRRESADERIKKLLELIPNPKNVVVVSDDKEIKFYALACRAKVQSVEDFLSLQDKLAHKRIQVPVAEINYTQMHKINEELKKLWLS